MRNLYWLVTNPLPNRLNTFLTLLAKATGKRELPHEIGHYRLSLDQSQAILQGSVDTAEETDMESRAGVTLLGDVVAAKAYIAANAAKRERGLA